jgi:hypothetical protein
MGLGRPVIYRWIDNSMEQVTALFVCEKWPGPGRGTLFSETYPLKKTKMAFLTASRNYIISSLTMKFAYYLQLVELFPLVPGAKLNFRYLRTSSG